MGVELTTIIVDDYDPASVEFVTPRRVESYGEVAVFRDIAGNRWDLLGPN